MLRGDTKSGYCNRLRDEVGTGLKSDLGKTD